MFTRRTLIRFNTAFAYLMISAFFIHCKKPVQKENLLCTIGSEEFNTITDTWRNHYKTEEIIHEGRGNGTGPQGLLEGVCEMAAMTRPMSDQEFDAILKKTGTEPVALPVALEALAIITNKNNTVKSLGQDDVVRIFTDPDTFSGDKISVFGVNSASDRYRFFKEAVLQKKNVSDKIIEVAGPLELADRVSKTASGFGYARPAEIPAEVKMISINTKNGSVLPDKASLEKGLYPFARYFYIYVRTDKKLTEKTAKFLNFILSEKEQQSLLPHGLYPIPESERKSAVEKIYKL